MAKAAVTLKRLVIALASMLGLASTATPKGAPQTRPPTMELRARALGMAPVEIGISRETYTHPVWGLVMDCTFQDGGAYTFMALADGTTSLYFSNGGGIIGAGQHENIRTASLALLASAGAYLGEFSVPAATPLPPPGQVSLYLLTFDGLKVYSAAEDVLGNGRSPVSTLFLNVHAVIARVREQ